MIDGYINCVATELDAIIQVYNKHIIPRCIDQSNKNNATSERLKSHYQAFDKAFDELLEAKERLDSWQT